MKLEFSLDRLSSNTLTSNFVKIRPVEAELLHADGATDGRTDMTQLKVAFAIFANAPKNELISYILAIFFATLSIRQII